MCVLRLSGGIGVDLQLRVDGADVSSDELRSLRSWLLDEDELRGYVEQVELPAAIGRLGPLLDALQVAGPAAGVVSASLVAWLRTRVGDVRLVVTAKNGKKVELQAKNVRSLKADELQAVTDQLFRVARGDQAD